MLWPDRRQAFIWPNIRKLLIGPLGTNFSEISIEIHTFTFKKMHLKKLSAKWQTCCLGLILLISTKYNLNSLQFRFLQLFYGIFKKELKYNN